MDIIKLVYFIEIVKMKNEIDTSHLLAVNMLNEYISEHLSELEKELKEENIDE